MNTWREDLNPKIDVVHAMAKEFSAVLVPFDSYLNNLATRVPMAEIADDGIHPTVFGHSEMAKLWLSTVGLA
jgi:hypothetical protein